MHWRRCSKVVVFAAVASCHGVVNNAPTPRHAAFARLLRMEDTRRDEPIDLDSLLASDDVEVRAAAALTVGRLGARSHIATVRELAVDSDTAVAANALFSLGLLKDSTSVRLASDALRKGGARGVEAAWLLGEIGEAGRASIIDALSEASLTPSARGAVLLAAARLRPVPAKSVVPFLTRGDSSLAWRAAYAIARGRSAEGTRALLGLGASPWASVREQVARGASRSIAGDSLGELARGVLVMLVRDDSARVRVNAVRAAASYGAAMRTALIAAMRDEDMGVRVAAAQSIEQVLDSTATTWTSLFDAETTFTVRRALADGAAKRGIGLASRAHWSSSADWRERVASVDLRVRSPASTMLGLFDDSARDRDGRVRSASANALASLIDSATVRDIVRRRLRALLHDADVGVRSAALAGLAARVTVDDLSAALDAYERSRADADNDARSAFWRLTDSALAHAKGALPDSIERRLAALPRPDDPLERLAAARITRFAAWRDSSGTARPMAWYEARVRERLGQPPMARIETDRGPIELVLFSYDAPLTVFNFISLARRGYFDGQQFHRVVPNFVIQGGDPRGDGSGGPGYAIRDELNRRRYGRGALGMALSGPNTGGSQFFITHSPQPHLDGGYTVFGKLSRGADALDHIVQGDRIARITVY